MFEILAVSLSRTDFHEVQTEIYHFFKKSNNTHLTTKSHMLTYKWIVITKKIITLGSSSRFSTVKENVPESPKYNQTTGRANKGPSVKIQDTVISKNKQHGVQVRLIDDP